MNEPSNFVRGSQQGCPDNELENPPYVPGEPCLPAWNGDSAGVGDFKPGSERSSVFWRMQSSHFFVSQ